MCGIAGELRFNQNMSNPLNTKVMCDMQIHRGPDDEGYYSKGPVSLGIRRLAITDTTKGQYPLCNETSSIHLVFDGTLYSFETLRAELEGIGHRFRSKTDAETVVHGYEEWGIRCLERLDGMFAFALWDEPREVLWIARDHFGVKPLYYYNCRSFFTFASEIKSLLAHADISASPDRHVIKEYLWNGSVDNKEETFFEGIKRLPSAHHLLVQPHGIIKCERYWAPVFSKELDWKMSYQEIEKTRELLLEAIRLQLAKNARLGISLSGGIDSSSVVCGAVSVHREGTSSTGERIKTFSVLFPGDAIDETDYVMAVCRSVNIEHNPIRPTAEELWQDLPTLIKCQEEPFGSTGVYAQWRLMKRAKELGVKVILDGQGGDELLCGDPLYYFYYLLTLMKQRKYRRLLMELVRSSDLTIPLLKAHLKDFITYGRFVVPSFSRRLPLCMKKGVSSEMFVQTRTPSNDLAAELEMDISANALPASLRYIDKNCMCHGIEVRFPFLYRHFFEYVASLSLDTKLRNGWTKYGFRVAMNGIIPDKIRLRRSKIGLVTPEKKWIAEELRGKLKEFFSNSALTATEYYDVKALSKLLNRRTLTNYQATLIWRVLNLELWHREFFRDAHEQAV